MKKKIKKIVAGCLMGIVCFSSSLTVYAAEDYVMVLRPFQLDLQLT